MNLELLLVRRCADSDARFPLLTLNLLSGVRAANATFVPFAPDHNSGRKAKEKGGDVQRDAARTQSGVWEKCGATI